MKKDLEKLEFEFIKLIHDSGGRANSLVISKFRELIHRVLSQGTLKKKLTHKEILDYLKKEDILYTIIEDENDEGELEITGIELNTISGIMGDLREKQKSVNALIRQLKDKIKSNEAGVYFEKLSQVLLKDQTINFQKDCYFLDCDSMVISGCYISNRRKKIGDKPMITIASQTK